MTRTLASLFVGLWLALAAPAPARADPITIGVASFIGVTLTAGTVLTAALTFVWTTAVGLGLSYLAASLNKPAAAAEQVVGGTSGKLAAGGAVPRSFVVGRAMTAGSLAYDNTFGTAGNTPNAFFVQVISLSDLPVTGLAGLFVNGAAVTWNPGATPGPDGIAIPEYTAAGVEHLWVRFYDGTQVAADARLVALFGADPDRPYSNRRIGTGIAYAVVTALVNADLFTGFPQVKFVLDGVKLYDRRHDSTAGGSGAQRPDDPATFAFTANNAVIAENILRGIRYGGAWLYGAQTVTAAQLPSAAWFAAANECDAAVALAGGGSEPQFAAGGEIRFDQQPADALDELLKGCNGRLAEIGGVYKLRAGAAGAAVFSFTDADILSSEAQSFEPFPSLAQTVNHVTAKYVSPAEGWTVKDAPPLEDADLEAADGGRRQSVDVAYGFVTSGTAVQRLMKAERDTQRAFRKHALPMPPEAFVLEPLDVVSWTSTRNGYVNKTFEIVTGDDLSNLNMGLALKELDPNAYDWVPADDEHPVSDGPIAMLRPPAQGIIDPFAEPYTLTRPDGVARAAIRIGWDPAVTDCDGVRYEVRLAAGATVVLRGEGDAHVLAAGAVIVSQNLLPATAYQARVQYRPASDRAVSWSGWLDVTTPTVLVKQAELEAAIRSTLDQVPLALSSALLAVTALSPTPAAALATSALVYQNVWQHIEQQADVTMAALLELQAIRNDLRDAGIKVDPANGRVTLWALNAFRDQYGSDQTNLSITLDAVRGDINLRATTTQVTDLVNAAALGFTKAYDYNFSGSVTNSWTGVNATLTAGSAGMTIAITAVGGYAKTPTISLAAGSNKLVQIAVKRTAGTGWGLKLLWGASFANSLAFSTPTDPSALNVLVLSLDAVPAWTGTLTGLAIAGDNGTTFELDSFAVGSSTFQSLALAGVETRVSVVELNISSINGALTEKASTATVTALTATVANVSNSLDSLTGVVSSKADVATVTALSSSFTTVQTALDAVRGNLTFLVDTTRETPQAQREGDALLGALLQNQFDHDNLRVSLGRAQQVLSSKIDDTGAVVSQLRLDLQAQLGANAAGLVSEQQTRADAVSALAQSITTLTAATTGPGGSSLQSQLTQEVFTRSTQVGTLAGSITTMQSQIGSVGGVSLQAQVSSEIFTRAQADTSLGNDLNAVAGVVSTLQTKVGSYTNTVTIGAIVTNLSATYALTLDVNGHLGGLVFANTGAAAMLSILGDVIVDGTVTTDKLAAGSVVTGKLAAGAVTANEIAAGAVAAGKLAANSVTAGAIATGALNAANIIADDVIVRGKLQADTATRIDAASAGETNIAWDAAFHDLVAKTITSVGGAFTILGSIDLDHDLGPFSAGQSLTLFDSFARVIVDDDVNKSKTIRVAAGVSVINGTLYGVRLKGSFSAILNIGLAAGNHTIKVQAGGAQIRASQAINVKAADVVIFEARR
jgi:Putative phage tail protein